ncbi:Morn repeat protein [Pandoravirus inopinatum]|uniref:Morn repeat protein n=1 Tax=Pandoravirus inopinatum TaxID=1605721 RepID=A0A0B5JCA0_9VIRU|nr:Morn repeat protein [Pandoravirus inopinatum]AJF97212.1 Morn repeat protein [Pandoravirus inopinatum]
MTEAPNYNGVAHEMRQACEQDLNIPATIDNLPVEIQVMILNGLTTAPDLLALRATSRTWRLLMSGDRGPVLALCRTLLSDEAVNRLATHPHADVLACIVYGILKTAGASLRSIEPIDQYCTTYWVPRVMGTFCGWGLSLSKVRVYGAASLCTWSVGRWSDGKLVDGMTRAPHMVPEVPGCRWRPHVLPAGSPCARCRMRRTMWTGRVVGGVAHGHGVWKISRCQECRTNGGRLCKIRCAGRWTKGTLVRGTMAWGGNCVYNGEFKDNFFHGLGTLDADDHGAGTRYVGHWSMGRPHGHGTLVYERVHDNDPDPVPWHYVGDWDHGVQTGTGTKEWADGRHYTGEWHDGRPHGRGSLKCVDGSRYDGEWHRGARHGQGNQFGPDGRLQRRGYWIHNSLSSRLAFRHAMETGHERSIARCALTAVTHPFHVVSGWLDTPLNF